jgi:hypothetical protein
LRILAYQIALRIPAYDPHLLQFFPAGRELIGIGHVSHRAAGGQIRKDDLLMRRAQNVRALRHEVDTAEHDEVGVGPAGDLTRQLE